MKRKRILSAALCALMTLIATSPADAVDPTRRTTPAPSGSTIPNTFGPNTFGNNPFYNPNGSGGAINPTQAPANLSDPTSNNLERNRNNLEMTPNDSRLNPYLVPQNPNDQLPGEPNKPRWTLGVYSRPTEVGEQILQVVSDTAAMRAGLEPNDIIIAVGGYQVGTVNGDTFDLSREFNMRADQSGNVNLLVQDHRNQQLVNVPVKLESRFSKITGSIAFRDRLSIPAGAVCTVELREVVRDGAPVVPLSRTVVDKIERIPIPFEIEYDPEQIDSRRDYTVHATITNANRTLYASRTDTRVITDGYPTSRIALSVEQLQNQGGSYTREQELDQLVRWFREYLQRDPRALEMAIWNNHLDRGGSLAEAQAELLSGHEFYNTCNADTSQYISRLHQEILGRPASREEIAYWSKRLNQQNGVRREVARQFLVKNGRIY